MRLQDLFSLFGILLLTVGSTAQSVQWSAQLVLSGSYQNKSVADFQNNLNTPQTYTYSGYYHLIITPQDVLTSLSKAYYLKYQKPLSLNQHLPVGILLLSTNDSSPSQPLGIASEYMSAFQNVATSGQGVSETGTVDMSWTVPGNSWTDFWQIAFYDDNSGGSLVSTSFINVPHGTPVNSSVVTFTVDISQTYSLYSSPMMGNPSQATTTFNDGSGHGLVSSLRFWWHDGFGTTIDGVQASYTDGTSPSHCTGGQCPTDSSSTVSITTSDPIQTVTVYYSSMYVDSVKLQFQSGTTYIAGDGAGDTSQSVTIPAGYYLYTIAGGAAPWGWGSNMMAAIQFGFTQQTQT